MQFIKNKIFRLISYILFFLFPYVAVAQTNLPAYQLYDNHGKKLEYSEILEACKKVDIIFFGELHNSSLCHWIQLQITKDLFKAKSNKLILGFEMFETDDQLIINEYLNSFYKEKNFEKEVKLWPNYKTDYKPIIEFAFENKINVVATNIPRRYASMVHYKGLSMLDSLPAEAKTLMMPLPLYVDTTLSGYREMLSMPLHGTNSNAMNMVCAQAVKDATMAYKISKNFDNGNTFLHFNGNYHSANSEGIVWYLKKQNPNLKIKTIITHEMDLNSPLDSTTLGSADFILGVPEDMTKTY